MTDTRYPPGSRIVSYSGTQHIAGPPATRLHSSRISTLCGFGIRPDEAAPAEDAVRECPFCAIAKATQPPEQQ